MLTPLFMAKKTKQLIYLIFSTYSIKWKSQTCVFLWKRKTLNENIIVFCEVQQVNQALWNIVQTWFVHITIRTRVSAICLVTFMARKMHIRWLIHGQKVVMPKIPFPWICSSCKSIFKIAELIGFTLGASLSLVETYST